MNTTSNTWKTMEAREAVNAAYNNQRNFMTPNLVEYLAIGEYAIEISWGEGFRPGTKMYGVTVVTLEGEKTNMSDGGFPTLDDAYAYVKSLSIYTT